MTTLAVEARRPPASQAERLLAGRVGRPHGLDGSFRVVMARGRLLELGGELEVAGSLRRVVRRAGTDAAPIIRLEGCEDRAAAQALRGQELGLPRSAAPPLAPGEWWAEELVGCRVHDGEKPVGVVSRLLVLPSCEALGVIDEDGRELLVPMVSDAVRHVDVCAKDIDVDLGFLGEAAG